VDIHIGKEIHKVYKEKRLGQAELARLINTSPQNLNAIFKRNTIDASQLYVISLALDFDFFSLYSQAFNSFKFREGLEFAAYNRPVDDAELKKCQEEKKILEEKYQLQTENAVTLQKYIKLLEEKHGVVKREG
jgi:transcriptional regulator with XRE-family HTH domain